MKFRSKIFIILFNFLGVILLGVIDTVTGSEISFSIFYFIPIFIGCWYMGRSTGILLSFASAIAWFAADLLNGHGYSYFTLSSKFHN
ncbi:MAG: hypothetical protein A2161_14245 [Candidatus Schekmanbacteria bacterium RBG_13_48_7]|uniref:Uncharacterized protein n=1 Tax=Candidatus Schekmanbacteria bacterium RBG_13_48_7 TaxID=1817878 RepID=A0A1F7S245_9BACT|nr:MAG: hypothetical protein A2161_14245 [Candidatus Schekmanbacteria bacterium RBG_13_48_7]